MNKIVHTLLAITFISSSYSVYGMENLNQVYEKEQEEINEILSLVNSDAHLLFDVNKRYADGETLLYIAAFARKTDAVKALVGTYNANVNQADNYGRTPLYTASEGGSIEIVKLLLTAGADVNQAHQDGRTPLDIALSHNNIDVMKLLLLNLQTKIDGIDKYGCTPLHRACYYGQTEIVQLLCTSGANVNQVTLNGDTPLQIAQAKEHGEIIKLLINAGACKNKAHEDPSLSERIRKL